LRWYPGMCRPISQGCGVCWKGTESVSCGWEASFESRRGMRFERSGGGSRGPDRTYSSTRFSFSYQSNLVIFVSPTIATVQWNILRRHNRLVLLSSSSGMGLLREVLSEVYLSPPWHVSPLGGSSSSLAGTDRGIRLKLRFRCS